MHINQSRHTQYITCRIFSFCSYVVHNKWKTSVIYSTYKRYRRICSFLLYIYPTIYSIYEVFVFLRYVEHLNIMRFVPILFLVFSIIIQNNGLLYSKKWIEQTTNDQSTRVNVKIYSNLAEIIRPLDSLPLEFSTEGKTCYNGFRFPVCS